jgi:Flp pilus assembly protein TadG
MQTIRRLLLGTRGSEIAETAAVLPVLFSVLLGIFFFGRAYNIYGTITQAAMQGARAAVAPACATCPPGSALTADQIATTVIAPVLQASKLDPAAVQSLQPAACPCGTVVCGSPVNCDPAGLSATPSICVQQNVTLSSTAGNPQCGTSVAFQYQYGFDLPFRSITLPMKATAQMRGEN